MKTLSAKSLFLILSLVFSNKILSQNNSTILGAWMMEQDNITHLLLFTNQHYSYSVYNVPEKKFIQTQGGTWTATNGSVNTITEFNTADKTTVGKTFSYPIKFESGNMVANWSGQEKKWKQVDNGGGDLNATWRITGRDQKGTMSSIPPSARKTIKILTGTRFQWAAINTQTGDFFGTGGGTYTFKDGRYTETIEFFSRDSSRIGMQLSFDGKVEGKDWHHHGMSSKGDPIYEVWSKED